MDNRLDTYCKAMIEDGWSYIQSWKYIKQPGQGYETVSRRAFRRAWEAAGGRFQRTPMDLADTPVKPVERRATGAGLYASVETSMVPEDLLPEAEQPKLRGRIKSSDEYRPTLEGTRFVFTSAQNNTTVHPEFWQSLMQFCKHNKATLAVSRYMYNASAWSKRGGTAVKMPDQEDDIWYDPKIEPYVLDEQVKVCDGLIFCGELDILPTAANPLSSMDSYSGHNSAIIPHAKLAMRTLATMKNEFPKFLYTTGTVTLRNYIARRAGQIAEHHHVYGAMLVEVNERGEWFARQLHADDTGVFFDLDTVYTPHGVYPALEIGQPVITLGDIHAEKIDADAFNGAMRMISDLQPLAVIVHDLLDFTSRNHHNKKDAHFLARQYLDHEDNGVEHDFIQAANLLHVIYANAGKQNVYCIRSNHDNAFAKWLKEGSGFIDPINLKFWHEANFRWLDDQDDIYAWALKRAGAPDVKFVGEDDGLVINGIEYGLHGHLGPNGSRGSPRSYRQLGRRAVTGHTHTAGIIDGVWTVGVLGNLDMGYNVGPSSWSHTNCITHPNGKRQLVTQRAERWRA